jgi:tRNA pseudouridine55 synthase
MTQDDQHKASPLQGPTFSGINPFRVSPGIFAVYKPRGISSYDVIRQLKRACMGEKIGHGGTLDPEAEGVIVIAVGRAYTKQLQPILKGTSKTYEATLFLGATSETDDAEGPITMTDIVEDRPGKGTNPEKDGPCISASHLTATLETFLGTTLQTPPRYSAVKIAGQPAYKRARRGEDFTIEPKPIHISAIELLTYEHPHLTIRVTCGSGTYIRVLARNIGEKLGTGAYLTHLKRTAVGEFTLEKALLIRPNISETR